jgi:serine/threonine protein kinase
MLPAPCTRCVHTKVYSSTPGELLANPMAWVRVKPASDNGQAGHTMSHPERDQLVGSIFAGHRIDDVVGVGGMGTVYRATDLALDRATALKVIRPALAGDAVFRRRFMTESKLAASVDHPNVIDVFHAGEEDGVLYVTMRLVQGHDLRRTLARAGSLDPTVAIAIAGQAAAALDAAHARGLVHRDVKPANVLLDENQHVFLTDFGLSKRVSVDVDDADTETVGLIIGTLDYIAPEQIRHEAAPPSDIYSLGCVVFEMLTGSVPFHVRGEERKLWAHLSTPPPMLADLRPDLPPGFDPVLQRALHKDPAERHDTATAFVVELEAAARGESSGADASAPESSGRARPRRPYSVARHTRPRAGTPTGELAPELAALVNAATVAAERIRDELAGGSRTHPDVIRALDAYLAAIAQTAAAVQRDVAELARNPAAEVREHLRRELMRGRVASRDLIAGLKHTLLSLQEAERRVEEFRGEMRRQLVELDSVAGLTATSPRGDPGADRRLAGRLARLRSALEALLDEMASQRAAQLAEAGE